MPDVSMSIEQLHRDYLAMGDSSLPSGWKLVELAMPTIEKQVRRISRRPGDRGDLINDLCLLVLESLEAWDPSKLNLNQWVAMVAGRRLPKQIWKEFGSVRVENESQTKRFEIRESYEDDLETIDSSDQVEQIKIAVYAVLNEEERRVLQLRSEDVSINNMASILGCSTTRLSAIEQRAIEKVKRALGTDDAMDRTSEIDQHEKAVRALISDCLQMAVDAASAAGIDILPQVEQLRRDIAGTQANRQALERSFNRHKQKLGSAA